jgi:hypothetical protein
MPAQWVAAAVVVAVAVELAGISTDQDIFTTDKHR